MRYAMNDTADWLRSQTYDKRPQQESSRGEGRTTNQRWERPPQGLVKCNYDGSFSVRDQSSKAGLIIREGRGYYMGTGQGKINKTSCAIEAEFQALTFCNAKLLDTWLSESYL